MMMVGCVAELVKAVRFVGSDKPPEPANVMLVEEDDVGNIITPAVNVRVVPLDILAVIPTVVAASRPPVTVKLLATFHVVTPVWKPRTSPEL